MDDLTIIELYFARNEKAIEETDKKYGKLCYSVANNILFNDEDSEECVNDTYLSVWNKIPPTRPNNFMAFICQIKVVGLGQANDAVLYAALLCKIPGRVVFASEIIGQ